MKRGRSKVGLNNVGLGKVSTGKISLDTNFSATAFLQGLVAGLFLLLVLAAWLWYQAPVTLKEQQAKLAFVSVPVTVQAPPTGITLENLNTQGTPQSVRQNPASQSATSAAVTVAPVPAAPVILPPAPIDGLTEQTDGGRLPVINSKTGHTPFQAYRRPFDGAAAKGKPVISLIVTDFGLSKSAVQSTLTGLPPSVSLALSPYAATPDTLVSDARAKGHEVWMELPMQSANYPRVDPGPYAMLKGMPAQENLKKLNWLMAQTTGYAGFIGTANPDFMGSGDSKPIIAAIYARGLGLIDSSVRALDMKPDAAHPYTHVDVWFDRSVSKSDLDQKFQLLEGIASRNGHALGAIQPLPLSYSQVKAWTDSLAQKSYVLAPASAQMAP